MKILIEGGRVIDVRHVQIENDVTGFGLKHRAVALPQHGLAA